jgi:transposase
MKRKGSKESKNTAKAPRDGRTPSPFDREAAAVRERLRRGPGEEARRESAPTARGPRPSRWTLPTIRATFKEVAHLTLSGVWRWLHRLGIKLRSARVQQYSPDPKYAEKLRQIRRCLREARMYDDVVALFLDEMGYTRWPDPAPDWSDAAPALPPEADRGRANNGLWRIIGAMNACTGRVHYLDNYIVGRRKVIEMYEMLHDRYRRAQTIYVIQDNWSIHQHADVLEVVDELPRIQPVWLPTYAPWLNPIEKLWRWLKQDVLKMHRLASDWPALRERVNAFLDQFSRGSRSLLRYCGLLGDGALASPN